MASIHKKRLNLSHTFSAEDYNNELQEMLLKRKQEVMREMFRLHNDSVKSYNRNVTEAERMSLPEFSDVFNEKKFIKNTIAESKLINDDIRESLTGKLKDILKKQKYWRMRGKLTGTLKDEALMDFQKTVKKVFEPYVKRDPQYGVPSKVKSIATTQLRNTTNSFKDNYFGILRESNEDLDIMKKWKHNPKLSANPRKNHARMGRGKAIPYSDMFLLVAQDGTRIKTPHPHWEKLPAGEVINCNCEVIYLVNKRRRTIFKGI